MTIVVLKSSCLSYNISCVSKFEMNIQDVFPCVILGLMVRSIFRQCICISSTRRLDNNNDVGRKWTQRNILCRFQIYVLKIIVSNCNVKWMWLGHLTNNILVDFIIGFSGVLSAFEWVHLLHFYRRNGYLLHCLLNIYYVGHWIGN